MNILRYSKVFVHFFRAVFVTAMVFFSSASFAEDQTNFEHKFQIQTTAFTKKAKVYIYISAKGTFYIDWGDGTIETKTKTSVGSTGYDHSYAANNDGYTISLGGLAEEYLTSSGTTYNVSAIAFYRSGNGALSSYIKSVSGSLGAIFPTIGDVSNLSGTSLLAKQPRFIQTFRGASSWDGRIPYNLFAGINGPFADYMFMETFYQCSKLQDFIPDTLFNGLYTGSASISNVMKNVFYYDNTLATVCPVGTEQFVTGYESYWNSRVACSLCPAGKYNNTAGSTCQACAAGTFSDSVAQTSCASCPAGTYNDLTGQSACTLCPADTYNTNTGSTNSMACLACPTGMHSASGSTSANDCSAGACLVSYNGVCAVACSDAAMNVLKTNTGISVPVWGNKLTTPSLNIQHGNTTCYVPLIEAEVENRLGVNYDNKIYSACEVADDYCIVDGKLYWADPSIYLKSKGQQYIDTGIVPDLNTSFEIEMADKSIATYGLFGVKTGTLVSTNTGFGISLDNSKFGFFRNGTEVQAIDKDNDYHVFYLSNTDAKIDGVSYNFASATTPINKNQSMYAFGFNHNGLAYDKTVSVRYVKIWQGNTLVRHLVPVPAGLVIGNYTVPENGMFDIVTQTFFANGGISDFEYGKE